MNKIQLQPATSNAQQSKARIPGAASKLRVAIVSDAIEGRNGVGTYYSDLTQHLQTHVQVARVLAPENTPNAERERFALAMPGDKTQRLAWPKVNRLFRDLDGLAPNVVVIPSLGPHSYFALRYAQRNRIPFAIVHHTNFDHLLALYWPKWLVSPVRGALKMLNRYLCRRASGVAAMNSDAFQYASQAGAPLTRVLGTPLAFDFLKKAPPPAPSELRRCIFIGRLAAEKGIQRILEAAERMPNMLVSLAGDGPLRGEVESAAKRLNNVDYLGWIDRGEVLSRIDQNDALLLPSLFETFGTVALEALARKRFVITSRDCGIFDWPAFSQSLFPIERGEELHDTLHRVSTMENSRRIEIASQGWDAVALFNEHAVRNWLRFLCDSAFEHNSGNSSGRIRQTPEISSR